MRVLQEARLSICSQSLHVHICDCGWERTRRRHPRTESPPTAITSASEKSTDSEVFSVISRGPDTINTSMVFATVIELAGVLGLEARVRST